jgi:hypothetical protein
VKERLKFLYGSGSLSFSGLLNAVAKGWITPDEAVEIAGEERAAEILAVLETDNPTSQAIEARVATLEADVSGLLDGLEAVLGGV